MKKVVKITQKQSDAVIETLSSVMTTASCLFGTDLESSQKLANIMENDGALFSDVLGLEGITMKQVRRSFILSLRLMIFRMEEAEE